MRYIARWVRAIVLERQRALIVGMVIADSLEFKVLFGFDGIHRADHI